MIQHSVLISDDEFLRNLTVLYVEDDNEVRDQLAQFLRRRVGCLLVAANGQEGLTTFCEQQPDLVITDILMPVMDGLAMAEGIREISKTVPIIVTTAFERQDYLMRSIDVGIDKYVVKPVRTDLLLNALHKCANVLRSEIMLRDNEERYRMMFQNFRIGVCIIAPDVGGEELFGSAGHIIDCNQAFLSLTGFDSLAELSARPYASLIPDEQRQSIVTMVREQLFELGFMPEYERQFVRRDGTLVPALVQSILRRDQNQRPYELWELVTDLTEHKRSQQQLHLAAKVFEGAGEAIMITDGQCRIISINQAFTRITGYASADVIGQNPRLLNAGIQSPQFYAEMWGDIVSGGYWQGEVWNRRKNGDVFPEWLSITALADVCGQTTHYIGIFSDISERKQAEERIRFLAQHDALTGLPNRLLLRDRLEHAFACAERDDRQIALLFLDLDNFKTINDSLGHQVGDQVLQQVANRLEKELRAVDTVCRQGGDEFIIVLNGIAEESDAAIVAEKLKQALARSLPVGDMELALTASIGIAIYPNDGSDSETLIKNADAAMYFAKQSGRNNFQFFTGHMNQAASERLAMESALRLSILGKELEVYFQPQIDLASGRLCGAEALLRWNHPQLGLLTPGSFIRLAEDSGLIVPIGEWVLGEVCRFARQWREQGLSVVPLAVNLSVVQFRQKNLLEQISMIIRNADLPPKSIELELTESFLMHDVETGGHLMKALSDLGVSLAIDDFGSAYSYMGYLKRFYIDKLKIDQSFVRDIADAQDSQTIVGSLINLAKKLGMKVVAEGIEEPIQAGVLKAQGCDQGQGYHFGYPMPAGEFMKLLQ